jgi:hypothetical protein
MPPSPLSKTAGAISSSLTASNFSLTAQPYFSKQRAYGTDESNSNCESKQGGGNNNAGGYSEGRLSVAVDVERDAQVLRSSINSLSMYNSASPSIRSGIGFAKLEKRISFHSDVKPELRPPALSIPALDNSSSSSSASEPAVVTDALITAIVVSPGDSICASWLIVVNFEN